MSDQPHLPASQYPSERSASADDPTRVSGGHDNRDHELEIRYAVPPVVVKGMADIATNAWKAKAKMVDGSTGEVRDEMKRVYRHVESVLETLHGMGLELKDHTGDAFDYGLPLKVVASQPTSGLTRESVVETIKPTIYWERQIIQMGEVVIATPSSIENKV